MMPVRSDDRSNSAKRGWPSSAMNIVGTPCSAVQRSSATALERGDRVEGLAREHHRRAGRHRTPAPPAPCRSSGTAAPGCTASRVSEKSIAIAMKRPLLTTLWCVSVAPFGLPVVPLVNWMLIGSSQRAQLARTARGVGAAALEHVGVVEHARRASVRSPMRMMNSSARQLGRDTFCSISRYIDVFSRSADTMARQPDTCSAYVELGQPVRRVDVDQDQRPCARWRTASPATRRGWATRCPTRSPLRQAQAGQARRRRRRPRPGTRATSSGCPARGTRPPADRDSARPCPPAGSPWSTTTAEHRSRRARATCRRAARSRALD